MTLPDVSPRDAVDSLVRSASVEVIPVKNAEEKVLKAPAHTTLTVTCSPTSGIARTLELSAFAARRGHRVVPHLAARQVTGVAELRSIVRELRELGITDAFVIGGDADEPAGDFTGAADLLEALAGLDHGLRHIGVGCYPEGHPRIGDEALADALRRKQPHADYMVSQLCFDSGAIAGWLREMRSAGVTLPLRVGLAGPLSTRRLVELSVRIGVGQSLRFLTKQHGLVGNLVRAGVYKPEDLLQGLGDDLTAADLDIAGVHLFSFNQVQAAVDWQRQLTGERDHSAGERRPETTAARGGLPGLVPGLPRRVCLAYLPRGLHNPL
jgi:methylenetetrahydrofolate reductase (NADPH)